MPSLQPRRRAALTCQKCRKVSSSRRNVMTELGWERSLEQPIVIHSEELVTLRDADEFIAIAKERARGAGMASGYGALILVAQRGGLRSPGSASCAH